MAQTFTLLLLYNKLSASAPVAHALTEKGIQVLAVDNSSDFANYLNSREIDMVGLSVNHANEADLARILEAKLQLPYFAFAEDEQKTTKEKLAASASPMKIIGVASGYTIWKSISATVKNKVSVEEGKVILSGKQPDELGDVIVMKDTERVTESQIILKFEDEHFQNLGKVYTEDMKRLMESVRRELGYTQCHEIHDRDVVPPIKKLTATIVGTSSEHGILLMGTSTDKLLEGEALESFVKKVRDDFKHTPFILQESFKITMEVKDICGWARNHSLFTFIHSGNTQFASLLKCPLLFPTPLPTDEEGISMIRIEYVPETEFAEFDVYLYFNRNNKLVPYLKKGDPLKDKIKKMREKGVELVCVQNTVCLNLKEYYLREFVHGALNYN